MTWTPATALDGVSPSVWLDAGKIVGLTDGDAVTIWTDASTNGNSPEQTTVDMQPDYKTNIINGLPVVRCGENDALYKTFTLDSPVHVFIVAKVQTPMAGNKVIFDGMDNSNVSLVSGSRDGNYYQGGLGLIYISTPELEDKFCLVTEAAYATTGDTSYFRVNGLTRFSGAVAMGSPGGIVIGDYRLYVDWTGSSHPSVDFAEVIVYPAVLSSANQTIVENYLNDKYALGIKAQPAVTITGRKTIRQHAGGDWYGRASTKVLNGVVIMPYRMGTGHVENDGALHIKFSNDYGATWSDEDKYLDGSAITGFPMNPPDCEAGQDANESFIYIAPNGNLVLHLWKYGPGVGQQEGTYQSISTDGGKTWSAPAALALTGVDADHLPYIYTTDDGFNHNGVMYAAGRDFSDASAICFLMTSVDNGVNWVYISTIAAASFEISEAGIEYLGSNHIIALLRDSSVSYRAFSKDMGETWVQLGETNRELGVMNGRHRIYTASHLRGVSAWSADPNLVACGFYMSGGNRINCVWVSNDAGYTWAAYPLDITPNTDGGYGDLFYNPTTGEYIAVMYIGTMSEADITQYNFLLDSVSTNSNQSLQGLQSIQGSQKLQGHQH
jgi:hypothetical protein